MPSRLQDPDEYELVNRDSSDSNEIFDLDDADFQSHGLTNSSYANQRGSSSSIGAFLSRTTPFRLRRNFFRSSRRQRKSRATSTARRVLPWASRRICLIFQAFLGILVALVLLTSIFRPSYSAPPVHYQNLRERVESSKDYGRANPENEKIFIAASIYDEGGHLLEGAWGEAVLELLDILGNKNVFLSIYENESGEAAEGAKIKFERRVQCQHSLVYDHDFTMDEVPSIKLPDNSERVKRIAYLAEVRNKALLPLKDSPDVKYDKLLYLNDVLFDPVEAAQLLLSTNLDERGRTSYRAACAVDFINPFKFYDTYATRDLEGYSMGVPFFPWFTNSGEGMSRQDVLDGKDAVRVKSCWGGMVAFDAKPFQADKPLRFRATPDTYWDASECCLVHADLLKQGTINEEGDYVGVYMNPFVRVAYGSRTLRWLSVTRRFEKLYAIPHNIINHLVGLPWFNPRRAEVAGTMVEEKVWVPDAGLKAGGSFQLQNRDATGDGFCGIRMLQLIKETPRNGEKNWEKMPLPSG